MTTWAPLCAEQPIEGEPTEVRSYGRDLERTARLIEEQAEVLRSLADPASWLADTADAFREQARDLEQEISKAQGRFDRVGGHVVAWADMLDEARRQAGQLREQAQAQQRILDTTSEAQPQPDPDNPELPPQLTEAGRQNNERRRRAQQEIDELRGELERLVDQHDANGQECGRLIRAAQDDGLNDGFWDRVKAWIAKHAPLLRDIATWAGRIAAIVGIVAFFCTPLGWLAAAAAAIAVLASGLLLMSGDGSLGSFLLNVVGLATFGLGGAAARGVAAAFRSGRLAQVAPQVSATRAAIMNAPDGLIVRGLSRLPIVGPVTGLGGRAVAHVSRVVRVRVAVRGIRREALDAPLLATSLRHRVLYGGSASAAARAEALTWIDEQALAVNEGLKIIRGTNVIARATTAAATTNVYVLVEESLPQLPPADEYADVGRR